MMRFASTLGIGPNSCSNKSTMGPIHEILREENLNQWWAMLAPYARSFARIVPATMVVPALSMRGAPGSTRIALTIMLAVPLTRATPWPESQNISIWITLLTDVLYGVPFALLMATPLWVAMHVGALADTFRGVIEPTQAPPPAADGARGPLATLSSLIAASAWLSTGGLMRGLTLLSHAQPKYDHGVASWALAARTITDALRLGILLSSTILIAIVALELASAAITRVATPISPQMLTVIARPLIVVFAFTLSCEMMIRYLF